MNVKKHNAQKDILYITISSFILMVLWVGSNIYHAAVSSTIAPDLQLQIQPIDPSFNTDVIQKLKTREKIAPLYETVNASSEADITQQPNTSETPVASNSGVKPTPTISTPAEGKPSL